MYEEYIKMTSDPQLQAQHKMHHIISQLHRILSQSYTTLQQSRDLQPDQNIILSQLDPKSIHYQNLVGILAIDTYVHSILNHMLKFNQVSQVLNIHIQNFIRCQNQNFSPNCIKSLETSLFGLVNACHQFSPNSSLHELHNKLLKSKQCYSEHPTQNINQQQQNERLKQQLKETDRQIIQLQFKLTNILKEQNDYQMANDEITSAALREELWKKQEQIRQMNSQFSYEIQKYNTVFDSMKQQINQLKAHQQSSFFKDIELMENQINNLIYAKKRDQLLIEELEQKISYMEARDGNTGRVSVQERPIRNYGRQKYYRNY